MNAAPSPCPPVDVELSAESLALIDLALAEDLGPHGLAGDLSVRALGSERARHRARAKVVAKARGVLAGTELFRAVFERLAARVSERGASGRVHFELAASDGRAVEPGDLCFVFSGPGDLVLAGERTALNFLQRLSGVATRTREFVRAIEGTGARILDTRKTTPGWRLLEKSAVRHGGGTNHRLGLYDQVLLKENHFALAGGDIARITAAVRERVGAQVVLTAEAQTLEEALAAASSGADVVMLDNFDLERARAGVARLREGRARGEFPRWVETEISGGVRLENVRAWAETGVDRISIGALTHSAPALDTSLLIDLASADAKDAT
ncbi:MAG: carboxylating nicotinate-nucleotide diphosphorylase [Planctomycetes bacterium]|nr:carboxylating nicotinate-nucleotide diphosphorylase [Planctomycetota bacterium]